jgi:hypothetical protein
MWLVCTDNQAKCSQSAARRGLGGKLAGVCAWRADQRADCDSREQQLWLCDATSSRHLPALAKLTTHKTCGLISPYRLRG